MADLTGLKCLIANGPNLLTFNSNNRWVSAGVLSDITTAMITNNGFDYTKLSTSLTEIYLNYTQTDTLTDGSIVYESEQITSDMNVSALVDTDDNRLKCTVPAFLPKDKLPTGYKVYAYTTTSTFAPYINGVTFSANSTHGVGIDMFIDCVYNFDAKVKYRYKINSGEYTEWSEELDPFNILTATIPVSKLSLGANSVTVEVTDALTESKTGQLVLSEALQLTNNTPEIIIVSSDSNEFKLHFIISDADNTDLISYRLTLTNSKYTNEVLVDWTTPAVQPVEVNYYIDTSKIVVDDTNIISIDYRDDMMTEPVSSKYIFQGQYKNILFVDESGEYLTSDKGAILKILDMDHIIAGAESKIKKVTVKNNNVTPITNLVLNVDYVNPIVGAVVKLSKGDNPFVGTTALDYGSETIDVKGTKDFYIKIESETTAEGTCIFDVIANADIAAE